MSSEGSRWPPVEQLLTPELEDKYEELRAEAERLQDRNERMKTLLINCFWESMDEWCEINPKLYEEMVKEYKELTE